MTTTSNNTVTISSKLTNVELVNVGGYMKYRFHVVDPFKGITKVDETTFEEAEVKYFDLVPSVAFATIFQNCEDLASIYAALKEQSTKAGKVNPFGALHLKMTLKGSTIEFERKFNAAGELYTDSDGNENAYQYDNWQTQIKAVVLNNKSQEIIDDILFKLLGL